MEGGNNINIIHQGGNNNSNENTQGTRGENRGQKKHRIIRNPLLLPEAQQADILRSYQKDQYYKKYLSDKVSEASSSWFGQRTTLRYQKELGLFSSLAYFSLNTLRGKQTLGEEFCDIQLINEKVIIRSISRTR
jgi:peroxin-10